VRSRAGWALLSAAGMVAVSALPSSAYQRPGTTERASVSSSGAQANGDSPATADHIALTPNGRYVAFSSAATNLAVGHSPSGSAVYVRDRLNGTTRLVSVFVNSSQTVNTVCIDAAQPAISDNGRFVAFAAKCASSGVLPLFPNVYVRDMKTGTTTVVSQSTAGVLADSGARSPAISADGRFVAFESSSNNLAGVPTCTGIAGGPCNQGQVYVRDTRTGTTKLVSATASGEAGDGRSQDPSMSADGKFVAFTSTSSNLGADDNLMCNPIGYGTPSCPDVFLHNVKTGGNELISVLLPGQTTTNRSGQVGQAVIEGISANDRFVAFRSETAGLVPNTKPFSTAIYVRDRKTSRTARVSVDSAGVPLALGDGTWSISPDGRYTAFDDAASTLIPCADPVTYPLKVVALHDQTTGAVEVIDRRDYGGATNDCTVEYGSSEPLVSSGGRYVAFTSTGSNLVAGDTNKKKDVFVRDRGQAQGVGGLASAGKLSVSGASAFGSTGLVVGSDVASDVNDALTSDGANLIGASLAYRQATADLFVRLPVQQMPMVAAADPALVCGLDLSVSGTAYEVRAAKTGLDASFGLFRRDFAGRWVHVADLHGGYGTTGQEVVFVLPLSDIGAQRGGRISSIGAFTGLGSYATGVAHVIDQLTLGEGIR
jgi:Tol biopolymer transport system component